MKQTLKIVIPMAGFGTRLRPLTWSRPKQLLSVAGKTVIDHVLDMFKTIPSEFSVELIFIVGYLHERVREYMRVNHPDVSVSFVLQEELQGQSHAIYLTKEYLHGPMLMVFADTLIGTDLSFLADVKEGGVVWVQKVEDPRRFGVVILREDGSVQRLVEKPDAIDNDLAVVGFYYFKQSEVLITAIEEQMKTGKTLKGEYFLADAVNLMLQAGLKLVVHSVDYWMDAGTPEAMLDTNAVLLDRGLNNTDEAKRAQASSVILPPVFIHPDAQVVESVIGPHASIGSNCMVTRSVIRNSIVEDGAILQCVNLENSLVGQKSHIQGQKGTIFVGDNSDMVV